MLTMSTADLQARKLQSEGQTAYRNKDYSKALQLLTQAHEIHTTTLDIQLCILDNRAAVQEKIGGAVHLKGALSDARRMIRLQKSYVNGYLRAGKILQLQGSSQNALDLYRYGLEKLPPADEDGRRLLRMMYENVLARLEAQKAVKTVDMINVLPVELLEMVIQYIPFPSLMIAQRVSKSWQQFLLNSPKTFSVVDFSCAKKPLERTTIMLAVRRSNNSIKKALFNKLQSRCVEALIHLARVSPLLAELQLLGYEQPLPVVEIVKHTKNLKRLIIKSSVHTEQISEILTRCPALECLECFDVNCMRFRSWEFEKSKLQRLYLRIGREEHYPSDRMLPSLLALLPELRELEISECGPRVSTQLDFKAASHLAVLNVRKISTTNFPLLPSTIKHLTLAHLPNLNITPDDILKSPLPALQELDVSYNPRITNDILLLLLDTLSPRKLILDMCPNLNFETVDWLLNCGGRLEELSVVGNSTFSDSVSKEMGKFKMLRRLNIGNTQITGIGLLNLVKMSQKGGNGVGLQYVGCDHCEGVGYDAVEVARKMGITVSHRMLAEYSRGGRKIRYGE